MSKALFLAGTAVLVAGTFTRVVGVLPSSDFLHCSVIAIGLMVCAIGGKIILSDE